MATSRRPFSVERFRAPSPHAGPLGGPDVHGDRDTATILKAIDRLGHRLDALDARIEAQQIPEPPPPPEPDPKELPDPVRARIEEAQILRMEIVALARSIEDTKVEIARLRDQRPEGDRLTDMEQELDAIVGATEGATNGILDITETVSAMVAEIQSNNEDGYVRGLADDIQERLMGIFEHCNFQDLTGQRITKVVNAMKYIEDRIDRMMEIWGRDGFLTATQDLAVAEAEKTAAQRDRDLLNGPQTGNKGISQDEIDALFG
ncbi:protein phosphatase CheZ [Roseospira marina]|uniref:Protein phosphatase CheZ n=1 Tax=Roseospira marina TaxID=140057 RepID=A0A5M6IGY8_9PROT|nr:protein phosphatase CheZ [Roseospira marina]KAA5607494.1 protein phosphatase CheZ [Roseospira marina]MBB4312325.1 chemotaxis protein CheZ [Roseospira marina]MBB5085659.1 chemotaxis protein CheZ [Roseospira marina]